MTLSQRVCATAVIILVSLAAAAADVPEIPLMIADPNGGPAPAWVAAEVAVGADGALRSDLFGDRISQSRLNARLNREKNRALDTGTVDEKCHVFTGVAPEYWKPTGSLEELTTHSNAIISGRVLAMKQGFRYGRPGMLIRLDATYLKGKHSGETYLFYPLAKIPTSDGPVCAQPLGTYLPPQVGDRFLLFALGTTIVGGRSFIAVDERRQLVHEPRGGRAILPPGLQHFKGDDAAFDGVQRATAALLARAN